MKHTVSLALALLIAWILWSGLTVYVKDGGGIGADPLLVIWCVLSIALVLFILHRMKVVDETTDAIPGVGAATVRWVIPAAAATVPLVGVVAIAVIYGALLFDSRRQGIHDRAARTVVIDLRELPPPPAEDPQQEG